MYRLNANAFDLVPWVRRARTMALDHSSANASSTVPRPVALCVRSTRSAMASAALKRSVTGRLSRRGSVGRRRSWCRIRTAKRPPRRDDEDRGTHRHTGPSKAQPTELRQQTHHWLRADESTVGGERDQTYGASLP